MEPMVMPLFFFQAEDDIRDRTVTGVQTCALPILSQCFVGIDGATAPWAMAIRPTGARWAGTKDDAGIAVRVTRLHEHAPQRRVLAATGGAQRDRKSVVEGKG